MAVGRGNGAWHVHPPPPTHPTQDRDRGGMGTSGKGCLGAQSICTIQSAAVSHSLNLANAAQWNRSECPLQPPPPPTGAAKKVPAEEGIPYEDTKQAYQQLHRVVSRQRKQRRRQQLVDRVKEAIQDEREEGQEGGSSRGIMQRRRETQVNRLLQQMMQRKQTAALQL